MKHYTLPIIIERDADGFFVSCPALQGCYTQGASYDEAIANIKDAIRLHLEDRRADHEELTEAISESVHRRSFSLMPKLLRVTARQVTAALERVGFSLARQSGAT